MKTFKSFTETLIFIIILSFLCYSIYVVTGLANITKVNLNLLHWIGIVSIVYTLFPPANIKSNLGNDDK